MNLTDALFLTPAWTKEDISYVKDMCAELKIDPEEFFTIPTIESWLNPAWSVPEDDGKVKNFNAVGLVQFTRAVAIEYNWINAGKKVINDKGNPEWPDSYGPWYEWALKFHKAPVRDQLPFIRLFLLPFSKKHDISKAYRLYQVFLASSTLGTAKEPKDIIYPAGSFGYVGNSGLDVDGDGNLTLNDLRIATDEAKRRTVYEAIITRYRAL